MVRPTDVNLELYQQWVSSASQGEIFFGDQVHFYYKLKKTKKPIVLYQRKK